MLVPHNKIDRLQLTDYGILVMNCGEGFFRANPQFSRP